VVRHGRILLAGYCASLGHTTAALSLVEQHTYGQETEGKRAWGGFAIVAVQ
jgi:hypothetical protein